MDVGFYRWVSSVAYQVSNSNECYDSYEKKAIVL